MTRGGCGCDQDPVECNHEAALGYVGEKLRRVRELMEHLDSNDPTWRDNYARYFERALGQLPPWTPMEASES